MSEIIEPEICKKFLLGAYIEGHFHNIRGYIQRISLLTEAIFYDTKLPEELRPRVKELIISITSFYNYIEAFFNEINLAKVETLNLAKVLKEEIAFWNGNLEFKHNVKTELNITSEPVVKTTGLTLRGCLCLVAQVIFYFVKKGKLEILVNDEGIFFNTEEEVDPRKACKLLEPCKVLFEVKTEPHKIALLIKK
ncbi:MAG: hypothetical protein GXO57_06520 [Thermodesulfobacteria bacterium]|nr:hypothetical protein [Thermodesulfobacteriota bacterium]